MRTIFLLLAVMLYGTIQSQIVDRITVDGEVIAQPGDDVQGINIINTTTNEGVITGAEGDFTIRVGVNDRLEVTAIQFQKFTIVVDKGINPESIQGNYSFSGRIRNNQDARTTLTICFA